MVISIFPLKNLVKKNYLSPSKRVKINTTMPYLYLGIYTNVMEIE